MCKHFPPSLLVPLPSHARNNLHTRVSFIGFPTFSVFPHLNVWFITSSDWWLIVFRPVSLSPLIFTLILSTSVFERIAVPLSTLSEDASVVLACAPRFITILLFLAHIPQIVYSFWSLYLSNSTFIVLYRSNVVRLLPLRPTTSDPLPFITYTLASVLWEQKETINSIY